MKWRHVRIRHSLSGRLILLFIVSSIAFVILVGGSMAVAFHRGFQDNIRPHLVRYLEYVQADLGSPPNIDRARAMAARLPVDIHIFGARQWSSGDTVLDLNRIHYYRRFIENGTEYAIGEYRGHEYLVSFRPGYTLVFSIPRPRDTWNWHHLLPLGILLIVLLVLYHATRRLFRPIETIQGGVAEFGRGNLGHRISVTRKDELGKLAQSFNDMADDIQGMLEAKRQLLLAISHELRSPLTRAKVATELLADKNQRAEIHRDLNAMEQLIMELLETERLSSRHRVLDKTDVGLNRLIEELVSASFPDKDIVMRLPQEEIRTCVDVARMKLLLTNLIDNAIQHNPPDSPAPVLTLARCEDNIDIRFQDFGAGIEERHLPHLTEPFYRVDTARQRDTGGYGLGLYLCRVITEAHGGSLTIDSSPNQGTRVTVTLPATPGA